MLVLDHRMLQPASLVFRHHSTEEAFRKEWDRSSGSSLVPFRAMGDLPEVPSPQTGT